MAQERGQLISCHSKNAWNQQLQKGDGSSKLTVVYFTALWCGPCRLIVPFLTDLAKNLTEVTFLKVDVDELQSVAKDLSANVLPAFVFLKQGKIVDRVVGVKKEELKFTISKHIN